MEIEIGQRLAITLVLIILVWLYIATRKEDYTMEEEE